MADLKFRRVTSLPGSPEADAIYFLESGAGYRQFVTTSAGALVEVRRGAVKVDVISTAGVSNWRKPPGSIFTSVKLVGGGGGGGSGRKARSATWAAVVAVRPVNKPSANISRANCPTWCQSPLAQGAPVRPRSRLTPPTDQQARPAAIQPSARCYVPRAGPQVPAVQRVQAGPAGRRDLLAQRGPVSDGRGRCQWQFGLGVHRNGRSRWTGRRWWRWRYRSTGWGRRGVGVTAGAQLSGYGFIAAAGGGGNTGAAGSPGVSGGSGMPGSGGGGGGGGNGGNAGAVASVAQVAAVAVAAVVPPTRSVIQGPAAMVAPVYVWLFLTCNR